MASHTRSIRVTMNNMVNQVNELVEYIHQLYYQGHNHQASILTTMVRNQMQYIRDLEVRLSDGTPAPRRYSGRRIIMPRPPY
jgi:hypothetical protein